MSRLRLGSTSAAGAGPTDGAESGVPGAVAGRTGRARTRQRGQLIPLFALSIIVLLGMCAIVIDVSWYWANGLRVQRAADAAALAGAVYLPDHADEAQSNAIAAAQTDGYTQTVANNCVSGKVPYVCALQDSSEPRQLDVTVSVPVQTFFMNIFGIHSITATRTAQAQFTLKVPMGSPLNYYGVGDFYINTGAPPVTSVSPFTAVPTSGKWTNPTNAWQSGSTYTTTSTNAGNQPQAWSNLNFNTAAINGTITGVTVSFNAKVASGAACTVQGALSWNGTTWGNQPQTTGNLTTSDAAYGLGSSGVPGIWDSGHTWASGDFANGHFQVRLTYQGSGCGTLSLNQLSVTVYTNVLAKIAVTDPSGTVLASQGGWGAIITQGGNEQNGDAYAPANDGGGAGFSGGTNGLYNGGTQNGGGYEYVANLPSGGHVNVFDPGFCAMGANPSGAGNLGAGDHWIGTAGKPVSTYYTLWNTNGYVGLGMSHWSQVYTSGPLFENQTGFDPVNGNSPGGGATSGCNNQYHEAWWTVPTGTLAAGTYVLQVSTTNPTDSTINASTNAENMFAIEVVGSGGGSPTVAGNGQMAVYNNLTGNGVQQFYLAKIDAVTGAGKTAFIDLFDPGDVSGTATFQILSPDGGVQTVTSFTYTTDSNCDVSSGSPGSAPCFATTPVTSIRTALGGKSSFNNTWIHIAIPLSATYGSGGLWDACQQLGTGSCPGWWQVKVTTDAGSSDTTTWQVSLSGNPVHLILPQ